MQANRRLGRTRPLSRRGLLTGSAVAAGAALLARPAAAQPPPLDRPELLDVDVTPLTSFSRLEPSRRAFGALEFRGGLTLNSSSPNFGGWSGLVVEDGGRRLLMVSDEGAWLTADIRYQRSRLIGLDKPTIGPIVGLGGRPLDRKRDLDAEALTWLDGDLGRGTVLVGFERNQRIGRFSVSERGLGPPLGYLKLPAEARRMPSNKGLEAVAVLRGGARKGAVVAFAERMLDRQGHHSGWIWSEGIAATPQRLSLTVIDEFDITDAASLEDGSLLVLERKFRWLEGVRMRLRRIAHGDLAPGAVLVGETLLEADLGSEIDNMEGMSVHRGAGGETILTLLSDDNFNAMLQRTILLQFALNLGPGRPKS